MKKPTSKQTRLFQAKMFPRNGTTGQIEKFLHGKSLAGKEVRSYEDRKSTWKSGVQKAIRLGSLEEEVRMLSCRCLQMLWWVAVTVVAIPSQPALLM